jgi:perosamine synthetase
MSPNVPFDERIILTASVRTTFDLILQVLDLPIGSEIVMTCINIPDMVKIIRHHGLVPVPVEISDDTLGP